MGIRGRLSKCHYSLTRFFEAKFWLEPHIELANNFRLSRSQLKEIEQIIEVHHDELKRAWHKHFPG